MNSSQHTFRSIESRSAKESINERKTLTDEDSYYKSKDYEGFGRSIPKLD
jgi:hypothetical protein